LSKGKWLYIRNGSAKIHHDMPAGMRRTCSPKTMDELKKKDLGVRAMQNFAVNVNIDVHCMGGTYRLHERMLQQECAEDGLLFWSIRPHRFEHKILNDTLVKLDITANHRARPDCDTPSSKTVC
jgi:hypothetical protein